MQTRMHNKVEMLSKIFLHSTGNAVEGQDKVQLTFLLKLYEPSTTVLWTLSGCVSNIDTVPKTIYAP